MQLWLKDLYQTPYLYIIHAKLGFIQVILVGLKRGPPNLELKLLFQISVCHLQGVHSCQFPPFTFDWRAHIELFHQNKPGRSILPLRPTRIETPPNWSPMCCPPFVSDVWIRCLAHWVASETVSQPYQIEQISINMVQSGMTRQLLFLWCNDDNV